MDPAVWRQPSGTAGGRPPMRGVRLTEQEPAGTNGAQPSGRAKYTRVLLKLGGEMFGGGQVGLDPDVVHQVARQIAEVVRSGVQVAVVIRGRQLFPRAQVPHRGLGRPPSRLNGQLRPLVEKPSLAELPG